MKKINFVIVGVGNIGVKYAGLLTNSSHIELVAAVDIDFTKRTALNKLIPFFTSIEDFFTAKIEADVICVCTPNGLHPKHTIACLNNGYHVICEKPVALLANDVERMIQVEKESGKKVFAVMQNRYSPVAIWLKKILEAHKLGDVLFLQINCFWNRNKKYYSSSPWRTSVALGGGPLYSQFSHFIDLMIWLCGEPSAIKSDLFKLNTNIETEFEDSGIINFKIGNRGRGVFNFTTAAFESNIESSLTIIGTKGNVKVGGQYMQKLELVNMDKKFEIPVFEDVTKANQYEYYQGSADKHDEFLKAVVRCLKNDTKPDIGLADELHVIHFIEQALSYTAHKSY